MNPTPLQEELTLVVRHIADELRQGNCRLFIGAGLPHRDAGLPSTAQLTAYLLDYLATTGVTSSFQPLLAAKGRLLPRADLPLSTVAELYDVYNQRQELARLLDNKLKSPNTFNPTSSYGALQHLANRRVLPFIYTTNYDLTIENALGRDVSGPITKANHRDLHNPEGQRVRVVHLHGAIQGDANYIVITERDELKELTQEGGESPLVRFLRRDLATKLVVFIGYSLTDISFRLYHYLAGLYSEDDQPRHFAVFPAIYPGLNGEAAAARWRVDSEIWWDRKIRLLNLTFRRFFPMLLEALDYVEREEVIQRIAQEFDREPQQIQAYASLLQRKWPSLSPDLALSLIAGAL